MTTKGTMRTLDDTTGAVRVEDVYATGIHDLWDACTTPERLARWIARVDGDLRARAAPCTPPSPAPGAARPA